MLKDLAKYNLLVMKYNDLVTKIYHKQMLMAAERTGLACPECGAELISTGALRTSANKSKAVIVECSKCCRKDEMLLKK